MSGHLLYPYRFGIGQYRKVLIRTMCQFCLFDFFGKDRIRFFQNVQFLIADLTQDSDSQSRSRERLAVYQFFRQTEFDPGLTDFILEQIFQRFDDLIERHVLRKSPDIVMGFDHGRITFSAFDHIRIDRSLSQDIDLTQLLGFFFKDADEFFTNGFSFIFGIRDPFQFLQKALLRIDPDQLQSKGIPEGLFDHVRFVFSEKSVIHKDAGKIVSDRLV